ncbi:MAG TPA: aldehyde-activating protein [Rhodospirillales bacterium]|jgi:hypothetical protein|nr:aldehyde-activating protein [Porticoccaceae bacterium]HIO47859.1 aldehyde-activating protein [Candidatus Poribacteria bacterium]HIP10214.1 aldehyde-activating protein [Rhodospirillales bacterium]
METGGCLCGSIRYKFERENVVSSLHCHCTDCQKATGSGKATITVIPTDKLEIQGDVKIFSVVGTDGGHVHRGFCSECGSPIISYLTELPDFRFIKAGSLDDPSWVKVESSIWSSTAHQWDPVNEGFPSFSQNLPEGALG